MSNRTEVWALLVSRVGEWVTRAEVEVVGGHDTMRRLREVRDGAATQGYVFESRPDGPVFEYRLVPVATDRSTLVWRCAKCGLRPTAEPPRGMDLSDRFRVGRCGACGKDSATFKRE